MKDTTLIEILKTFNKEELKSLKKFFKSPFIRSRRNIGLLFDHLIQFYPEFNSPDLHREKVSEILFPDEVYNEKKIMNYVTDLSEACKDFLMHITLIKDEVESELLTSKGLYEKRLLNQSVKILNKIDKNLVQGFSADKDYFSKSAKIQEFKNAYYTLNNDHIRLRQIWDDFFEMSALKFLVDYTWMRCSNFTTSNTLYKKIPNNVIDSVSGCFDIDKMLDLADKLSEKFSQITDLHSMLLNTIKDPKNSENYFVLKEYFLLNISSYDREEKFRILCHMINFCGENIEYYGDDFTKEMLVLYKIMLKNNAYSLSGNEFLLVTDYRNIQSITVLFRDTDFLEKMMMDYSKLLRPENREFNVLLSNAYLYFLRNEFGKSLQMIAEIATEDFLFKIDIKKLKLMVCYELGYFEQAFSVIDTYKHYITNSKDVTEPRKKSSIDFLNAFTQLLRIKTGRGEENIAELKDRAGKLNVFLKDWFYNKIDELKKNTILLQQ